MNDDIKTLSLQVGDPLFLTPYIESGDIETGKSLASVDWSLLQVNNSKPIAIYEIRTETLKLKLSLGFLQTV